MNLNSRTKNVHTRLSEIEREMAELKKRRRLIERDWSKTRAEAFPEAARRSGPEQPDARETGPAGGPPSAAPAVGIPEPEWAGAGESGERRERFASLFMSGNMGPSAPQMRRERRALRNKAIIMAVFAIIFLIVLVRFMVK